MNRRFFSRLAFGAPLLSVMPVAAAQSQDRSDPGRDDLASAGIPTDAMQEHEHLIGYRIELVSANFTTVPVPAGWAVSVSNSPDLKAAYRASALIGSAAVNRNIGLVRFFFRPMKLEGLAFDASARLEVTTDFVNSRTIECPLKSMKFFGESGSAVSSSGLEKIRKLWP